MIDTSRAGVRVRGARGLASGWLLLTGLGMLAVLGFVALARCGASDSPESSGGSRLPTGPESIRDASDLVGAPGPHEDQHGMSDLIGGADRVRPVLRIRYPGSAGNAHTDPWTVSLEPEGATTIAHLKRFSIPSVPDSGVVELALPKHFLGRRCFAVLKPHRIARWIEFSTDLPVVELEVPELTRFAVHVSVDGEPEFRLDDATLQVIPVATGGETEERGGRSASFDPERQAFEIQGSPGVYELMLEAPGLAVKTDLESPELGFTSVRVDTRTLRDNRVDIVLTHAARLHVLVPLQLGEEPTWVDVARVGHDDELLSVKTNREGLAVFDSLRAGAYQLMLDGEIMESVGQAGVINLAPGEFRSVTLETASR